MNRLIFAVVLAIASLSVATITPVPNVTPVPDATPGPTLTPTALPGNYNFRINIPIVQNGASK